MDRQNSTTRVSIAQRIDRIPMNAADRDAARDYFLATEKTANRFANIIAALRRLVFGEHTARYAARFTRTSSSRMTAH